MNGRPLIALALASLGVAAGAEDWPQWRGPRADGTSRAATVPVAWGPDRGRCWAVDLPGEGHSSPVVSGGSVFVTTALGSGHERALLRLDAATGALRWSRTVARSRDLESLHSEHSHASSTPATDGSLVLAGGRLYATDDTGVTTVFEASPERYLQVARNEIGELVYATPAVADGRLFIRTKRRLHALGECAAAASPPSLGRAGGPGSTQ